MHVEDMVGVGWINYVCRWFGERIARVFIVT